MFIAETRRAVGGGDMRDLTADGGGEVRGTRDCARRVLSAEGVDAVTELRGACVDGTDSVLSTRACLLVTEAPETDGRFTPPSGAGFLNSVSEPTDGLRIVLEPSDGFRAVDDTDAERSDEVRATEGLRTDDAEADSLALAEPDTVRRMEVVEPTDGLRSLMAGLTVMSAMLAADAGREVGRGVNIAESRLPTRDVRDVVRVTVAVEVAGVIPPTPRTPCLRFIC